MSEDSEKEKERREAALRVSQTQSTIDRAKDEITKNQELLDRLKQRHAKPPPATSHKC
jgi:hypothetical protein